MTDTLRPQRKNLDPKEWGPCAWRFLLDCAQAYDEHSAPAYDALVRLLPEVLPCSTCRAHAAEYIETYPVDTADLTGWLMTFREAIRRRKTRQQHGAVVETRGRGGGGSWDGVGSVGSVGSGPRDGKKARASGRCGTVAVPLVLAVVAALLLMLLLLWR